MQCLDLFREPPALDMKADTDGRLELLLDFGTELEGELEIGLTARAACNVLVSFGESLPEAEGWGMVWGGVGKNENRMPTLPWRIPSAGRQFRRFPAHGFRFIRVRVHDVRGRIRFQRLAVRAFFMFRDRPGDFLCSDRRLQRAWQSSAYTARLCSRPDAYWDGIKRDRIGWYGDARITQETTDLVFHDPAPAESMLSALPTDTWANTIPNYSFDAAAMLKQLVLAHGVGRRTIPRIYARVKAMLEWAARTQTGPDGFLIRDPRQEYFWDIGYLDWAPLPVGGRLEELCWLQAKYIEALRNAALVARWLKKHNDAAGFARRADKLTRLAVRRFWKPNCGFIHTLNLVQRKWAYPEPETHYRKTYLEKIRLGPSGPSRQANALAALAGLCANMAMKRGVLRVFDNPRIPPVITGYFAYYEQWARAECGDVRGAIRRMRDHIGSQLEENDCATVWESYDTTLQDFRRWDLSDSPKSLCHGWSSGIVALMLRYLIGIRPVAPGFGVVSVNPEVSVPWTFKATIPTPHGPILAERDSSKGPVRLKLPKGVRVEARDAAGGSSCLFCEKSTEGR